MDVDAGMPILGAAIAALLLFGWLTWQRAWLRRWVHRCAMASATTATVAAFERNARCVRAVALSGMLVAPLMMLFSGQIDAYGIAHIYNDTLQIIVPLVSAVFAAAVAWLLVASPVSVHSAHCRLLREFRYPGQRGEFW